MPPNVESRIVQLLTRWSTSGQLSSSRNVYAEGLRGKVQQSRFSLEMLRGLELSPELSTGTAEELETPEARMRFYSDCFWIFLRSAFDILGQLVNTVEGLGIPENNVDIKRVESRLQSMLNGSPVQIATTQAIRSRTFRRLEAYRHISTHRRSVYIQTTLTTNTTISTPGYAQYGTSNLTQRLTAILCDDPNSLTPSTTTGHNLVDVCTQILNRTDFHIGGVIQRLQ